jgi:hypothetical protein
MRSRLRLMLLALLAVFAFGAVATAAAQAEEAPFWSIGGTRLGAGQTHYMTIKKYGSGAIFALESKNHTIACNNVKLTEKTTQRSSLIGSAAGNPGTNLEVIEFFEGCIVTHNGENCKVVQPIVTNPVKSELVETEKGEKGSLLMLFSPAKGAIFAKVKFEGTECKVMETAVTGTVAGQVHRDPNEPPKLGELVKLGNEPKEETSWLVFFLATNKIKEVWKIKEGVGFLAKPEVLEAFTEESELEGTALVSLAKVTGTDLESEEKPWSPSP